MQIVFRKEIDLVHYYKSRKRSIDSFFRKFDIGFLPVMVNACRFDLFITFYEVIKIKIVNVYSGSGNFFRTGMPKSCF